MKLTASVFSFLIFCILISCKSENTNNVNQSDSVLVSNTIIDKNNRPDLYDSLENVKVDTSTLKGKQEYILNHFQLDNLGQGDDTLFDLNYDGKEDYVIRAYGMSGTGIKNFVAVYLYYKIYDSYIYNEQLSSLRNPTFYIKNKKITSFYLAHGGGDGRKLEWIKDKWVVTKEFLTDNNQENTIWEITYPLKNKRKNIKRPYQMIPPEDILETNINY